MLFASGLGGCLSDSAPSAGRAPHGDAAGTGPVALETVDQGRPPSVPTTQAGADQQGTTGGPAQSPPVEVGDPAVADPVRPTRSAAPQPGTGAPATDGFVTASDLVATLMRIGGWAVGPSIDMQAPETTAVGPVREQVFTQPVSITASGLAADNAAVAAVQVGVYDQVSRKWLGVAGTFASTSATWFDATLAAGKAKATSWTWVWQAPLAGDFVIASRAVDTAGNVDATRAEVPVHVRALADTRAPSTPAALSATPHLQPPQVALSWDASADDVGVTGYEVRRDGNAVAAVSTTSWLDISVSTGVDYSYTVRARDAAGNWSATAQAVTVRLTPTPPGSWTFTASGLDGAGFQNVVEVDPTGSGTVLSGADVAGVHRSSNWGLDWRTSNQGLSSLSALKVADLAWSRSRPGLVYAATGAKGAGGGVLRSDDSGATWTLVSTVPQFSGGNNSGTTGLPSTHPRSTGDLLVLDEARGLMFAATFDDGVMRSSDGGATWAPLGLAGKYLRSLVSDPVNPDVLYVAAYGDGVYKTTTATGAGAFTRLGTAPASTEELAFVGNVLFAAAGGAGVFRSTDGGAGWARLDGPRTDGPVWISVAGFVDAAGRSVVLAGCDKPAKGTKVGANQMFTSVVRSVDGGSTWTSLTDDPAKVHYEMGDSSGAKWWLASAQPFMMIDKGSFTAAQIVVDASGQNVFVAGRSGVWRSPDGGANWWPAVRGMGVTINRDVVADPNVAGRVYVGNTDWILLWSGDGGRTFSQNRPPGGSEAFGVTLDTTTTPSAVTVGVGDRDTNAAGEVYTNPDPATTTNWVAEGLGVVTGGKRPVAVAVNWVGGQRVLLAAVDDGGVWRKAGSTWAQVSSSAMGAQQTDAASFAWQRGSSTAFLYDRQSGVWRSGDAGQTWVKIWAKPSATEMTGYVALDPVRPDRLWVSAKDGLYRVDGAGSGSVDGGSLSPVELGSLVNPSEVSFDSTGALVTLAGGRAYRCADAATLDDVSDPALASTGRFVFGTSIGPDGRLYLALNGNGVLLGSPVAGPAG